MITNYKSGIYETQNRNNFVLSCKQSKKYSTNVFKQLLFYCTYPPP